MRIAIPRETADLETRVAIIPQVAAQLVRAKHTVMIESTAGERASFADAQYLSAGATIAKNLASLYEFGDILLKVRPPSLSEAAMLRDGTTYIGFYQPLAQPDLLPVFLRNNITSFSMEYVPRISRAQSMDALSSMANIAGYKAVLLAADHIGKLFPLMMTAAGTIPPAIVLVLGAGVAGLQAIATAKRLGAKVEAFDPRPAVKDQVKSLGATFVEMEMPEEVETAGGYAKEQSAEFIRKEMEAIAARLPKVDVVVTTAQIFGKRAPVLISREMVEMMKPGSVIVDIAAEQGGNCELTKAGATVDHHGVHVIGAVNLPASLPVDASLLYSRNIFSLVQLLYPTADATPDFADEIVKGACITRGGEVVHQQVKAAWAAATP